MRTTRQNKKAQRLSDFFPAIDAPSPIARKATSRRQTKIAVASTPASKTPTRKASANDKRSYISTPVFDPDIHGAESDLSQSFEDAEFVKSLTFSPAKAKKAIRGTPGPARLTKKQHEYEVIVDYSSESEGFAFSPVKLAPVAIQESQGRQSKDTTVSRHTSEVYWNSKKKRVESVSEPSLPNESRSASPTPGDAFGSSVSSADSNASGKDGQYKGSRRTSKHFAEKGVVQRAQEKKRPRDRSTQNIERNSDQYGSSIQVGDIASREDLTNVGKGEPHRADRSQHLAPIPRDIKNAIPTSQAAKRSPRIFLTRTVPGALTTQHLEQIPLPDFMLSSGSDTLRKRERSFRKVAQIPNKLKPTVPQPFNLSEPLQRHGPQILHPNVTNEVQSMTEKASRGQADDDFQVPVMSKKTSRKRKPSDAGEPPNGLSSPAKRIKLASVAARPVGTLRPRRVPQTGYNTAESQILSTSAPQRRDTHRQASLQKPKLIEVKKTNEAQAGLVPRTLYSPEKQCRLNETKSVTKPAPFKFSTEARAARSPSVAAVTIQKPIQKQKPNTLNVPVLRAAPFIPKPSNHQSTVAASPVRSLPSRLQIRREFDKVAEKHAEEALQRRRLEETAMAAERERRMEQRKGWQDLGQAAIDQWAKNKINSEGKRDWID